MTAHADTPGPPVGLRDAAPQAADQAAPQAAAERSEAGGLAPTPDPGPPPSALTPSPAARHRWALLLPLALALAVIVGRVLGPSDLSQNFDQSKTLAYTADVVLHGRWVLPRDNMGGPTTKPLLVNWVGAAAVHAVGLVADPWREWVLKLPAALAGLIAVAATMLAGWRLTRDGGDALPHPSPGVLPPAFVAAGAGLALASSPFFAKHACFLRPDLTSTAMLAVGWAAATVLLRGDTRHANRWALLLWTAMGLAALAKGFTALLLPLYILVAARVVHGRFAAAHRTRWAWGLPLGLAIALSWPIAVYLVDRAYLFDGLLGSQSRDRFGVDAGVLAYLTKVVTDVVEMIGWPLEGVGPWYVAAIVALVALPRRQWHGPVAGPCVVWIACVFAVFVPITHKGASYLLPMYPAVAVLAAVGWLNLPKVAPPGRSLFGLTGVAVLLAAAGLVYETRFSSAARDGRAGDALIAFADAARPIVGDDAVSFENLPNTPLATLLARHPADAGLTDPDAAWVVELVPAPALGPDTPQAAAERIEAGGPTPVLRSTPFESRQTSHLDGPGVVVLRRR